MDFRDRGRFLLCFGTQRGGTTWLSNQLRPHPGCDFPPRKELRYLDALHCHDFGAIQAQRITEFRNRLNRQLRNAPEPLSGAAVRELKWWSDYVFTDREGYNDQWYRNLFRHCDPEKLTGDISPDYALLEQEQVDHLKALLPERTRLIFAMRNPIERLWSGVTYSTRHDEYANPEQHLKSAEGRLGGQLHNDFSNYPRILERYENSFGRENILCLFHEDLHADPLGVLRKVCAWTDIAFDPDFFPRTEASTNRSPVLNLRPEVRREVTQRYIGDLEWLANRFGGHADTWLDEGRRVLSGGA